DRGNLIDLIMDLALKVLGAERGFLMLREADGSGLRLGAHRNMGDEISQAGAPTISIGIARQVAKHNVTINNLLPGPFDTDRLRGTIASVAKQSGKPLEAIAEERRAAVPAGRFGTTEEFGDACVFLCSGSAGFIVGHNLLMDGGMFNGTM
ncbi:MAG: SDR family oxidoreductase, partial [Proteobacteria bacterium]|nr:SDR family oxidoreductase [Pseudomonadota bacterium]